MDPQEENDLPSSPNIVEKGAGRRFLIVFIFVFIVSIVGTVLAANSSACQPYIKTEYGSRTWQISGYAIPTLCLTTVKTQPPILALGFISSTLLWCGIYQLEMKTSKEDSNTSHFHCIFTWAITLTAFNIVLSLYSAAVVSLSYGNNRECKFYYYDERVHCTTPGWAQSTKKLMDESRGAHIFYVFTQWIWILYLIFLIIVITQIRHWCCDDCKDNCDQSSRCACKCVTYAKNSYEALGSDRAVPLVTSSSRRDHFVPEVALTVLGKNTMMQEENEVRFWLESEVRLPQYVSVFVENGYERMLPVLLDFKTDTDLREIVPDVLRGHATIMLNDLDVKRLEAGIQ